MTENDLKQFIVRKYDEGKSMKYVKDIFIILKMITKYGIRKGLLPPVVTDMRFPSDKICKDTEILRRDDHKKVLGYIDLPPQIQIKLLYIVHNKLREKVLGNLL